MMKNIPILNIPKTCSKNEFRIYSENLIQIINNFYNRIFEHIDMEEKIAEQNKHKDVIKYRYYKEFYNFNSTNSIQTLTIIMEMVVFGANY
jgi:sulfur relay (sulfurtransferase) DsrC/TusE family protein